MNHLSSGLCALGENPGDKKGRTHTTHGKKSAADLGFSRHAALPGGAEGRPSERGGRGLHGGVRHHHGVVLRPLLCVSAVERTAQGRGTHSAKSSQHDTRKTGQVLNPS